MSITSLKVEITTDAAGAATVYTMPAKGFIEHLRYTPDGSVPLDTSADLTITGDSSGVAIATLSDIGTSAFTRAIRQATHGADGAAALYAAGGAGVLDKIALAGERIKIIVAQGGNAKKGVLEFVVSE